MASASQSYSSPFEMGIHLPPTRASGGGESGPPFPPPQGQRSKSETLDLKNFPMPPTQPFPAHSLALPVMDWGLPEFGVGLGGGRAAGIDRGLAGGAPHLNPHPTAPKGRDCQSYDRATSVFRYGEGVVNSSIGDQVFPERRIGKKHLEGSSPPTTRDQTVSPK
jgi:hypothetical protein